MFVSEDIIRVGTNRPQSVWSFLRTYMTTHGIDLLAITKDGCGPCDKAKQLLHNNRSVFTTAVCHVHTPEHVSQVGAILSGATGQRTWPFMFRNADELHFLGGASDLETYLRGHQKVAVRLHPPVAPTSAVHRTGVRPAPRPAARSTRQSREADVSATSGPSDTNRSSDLHTVNPIASTLRGPRVYSPPRSRVRARDMKPPQSRVTWAQVPVPGHPSTRPAMRRRKQKQKHAKTRGVRFSGSTIHREEQKEERAKSVYALRTPTIPEHAHARRHDIASAKPAHERDQTREDGPLAVVWMPATVVPNLAPPRSDCM